MFAHDEELKGQIHEILVYEADVKRELTQWSRIVVSGGPDRCYKYGCWIYDGKGKCTAFTAWNRDGSLR